MSDPGGGGPSSGPGKERTRSPAGGPIPVVFLASTLAVGGAERQLQHLILHLDRGSFLPHLMTLRGLGPVGDELAASGVDAEGQLAPARFPAPWSVVKLARRLRRVGAELLYCLDHTNAVVAGALAARFARGIPVLAAIHTTGQWGKPSLPRPVRMMLGGVSRLLAVAETQREYLVAAEGIPSRKITVIRNGIPPLDPAKLPSKSEARELLGITPEEGPVIGVIAMLRPEKAHENFLEAAGELTEHHPGAVFLLVGDGPRRVELARLAERRGIAGRVRFLGLRADVPSILPALDLSVLASHPRVETLPLSQMEAMSLGIPVVATRVGSLHELVEDGVEGRLVPPGEPGALAEAMHWVLSDPARAAAAGRAARERILREFTVDRVARETEGLMREVLG